MQISQNETRNKKAGKDEGRGGEQKIKKQKV